jgi:hypothetical protein
MVDFTWSYSSLKQYQNCPKQYYEIRVAKNYIVKENEAMMYGKEVHSALEDYVNGHIKRANKIYNENGQHVTKYGQVRVPIEELMNGLKAKEDKEVPKGTYKELGRHDASLRLCGLWYSQGYTHKEVRDKAFAWNQLNEPPLRDQDIESVVKSVRAYAESNPEPTLPKNYQRFKSAVDALINIPGKKYPELEMALTHSKEPCDFNDENRWVRGIADLVIIDGINAFVVDYKTGSNKYPDPKQLRLMALMIFTHFPEVQKVKGGLMFIMKNSFLTEEYHRNDMDKSWKMFEQPLKRLETSYDYDQWTANPTPLCGWCPVKSCEFWKPRRY